MGEPVFERLRYNNRPLGIEMAFIAVGQVVIRYPFAGVIRWADCRLYGEEFVVW